MAHGRARIGSLAVAATLLSLTACGTSSSGLAGPKLVTFPGDGTVVTIKNVDTALKDTSPAFRTFISNHLHELWKNGGAVPGCEGSALVSLTAYSATGFASASDEGLFGSDTCARGGNTALYATVNGSWQEIIGTQSGYSCTDLKKYKVPPNVAGATCLNKAGNPQPYTG